MTCGYDLRAHGHFEHCPECGTTVAQSRHHAQHQRERDAQHLKIAAALGWTTMLIVVNMSLQVSLTAAGVFVALWWVTFVGSIVLLFTIAGGKAERRASRLVFTIATIASIAGVTANGFWYWLVTILST